LHQLGPSTLMYCGMCCRYNIDFFLSYHDFHLSATDHTTDNRAEEQRL